MRYLTIASMLLTGLISAMAFTPAVAQSPGQPGYFEYRAYLASTPDTYYLFTDDRKDVASYKTDRILRVCVGDSEHVVPLKIFYDDKSATVEKNECMRVEGREIALEPTERLDNNAVIVAEVQTLN